jgi:hypothetical protein
VFDAQEVVHVAGEIIGPQLEPFLRSVARSPRVDALTSRREAERRTLHSGNPRTLQQIASHLRATLGEVTAARTEVARRVSDTRIRASAAPALTTEAAVRASSSNDADLHAKR